MRHWSLPLVRVYIVFIKKTLDEKGDFGESAQGAINKLVQAANLLHNLVRVLYVSS